MKLRRNKKNTDYIKVYINGEPIEIKISGIEEIESVNCELIVKKNKKVISKDDIINLQEYEFIVKKKEKCILRIDLARMKDVKEIYND